MSITIKRAADIVELCTDLELQADHDRLSEELRSRQKNAGIMENSGVSEIARSIADLEKTMRESTLEFTLQALPRKRFAEFEAANPPRDGDKTDVALGINISNLDELIAACVTRVSEKVSGNDVEFDAAAEWVALADDMSDGQWQKFALAALQVNRGATQAPFSVLASRVIQRSEESLKKPSD